MSNCIKPRTEVSIFGLLDGTARGRVYMPWLASAFYPGGVPAKRPFSLPSSSSLLRRLSKQFGQLENMEYHRPHCQSTLAIAMAIQLRPCAGNSK